MTTAAIMQPYFFPYIGYFQLIAASDIFILYDDSQYIQSGWSNRNRILRDCFVHYLTFPVKKANFKLPYCQRYYKNDEESRDRVLRSVREAYRRAPRYDEVMPLIESLMLYPDLTVSKFNRNIIEAIAAALGIATRIIEATELDIPSELIGPARVIAICRQVGAMRYVNMSGGAHLYDRGAFAAECLELTFLKASAPAYDQKCREPITRLSIIDVMMFNDPTAIRSMLGAYDLE